jgi:hypothetical protein
MRGDIRDCRSNDSLISLILSELFDLGQEIAGKCVLPSLKTSLARGYLDKAELEADLGADGIEARGNIRRVQIL